MTEATSIHDIHQAPTTRNALDAVLYEGARKLLQLAIEAEVAAYIEAHAAVRDEEGHRLVVRNARAPEWYIQTGLGPIPVPRPRVDDRRADEQGNQKYGARHVPPQSREVRFAGGMCVAPYFTRIGRRGSAERRPGEKCSKEGNLDREVH